MVNNIRLITVADLAAVVKIQDDCYNDDLYEAPDLLQQRITMQPTSCWLIDNSAGEVLAYLFSYPTKMDLIASLGSVFKRYENADTLYLHDMAVSKQARGLGLAKILLKHAECFAAKMALTNIVLVAVQSADNYWQKQGFSVVTELSTTANQALTSYGAGQAKYMIKPCEYTVLT